MILSRLCPTTHYNLHFHKKSIFLRALTRLSLTTVHINECQVTSFALNWRCLYYEGEVSYITCDYLGQKLNRLCDERALSFQNLLMCLLNLCAPLGNGWKEGVALSRRCLVTV